MRGATRADLGRVTELVNGAYRGESGLRGWTTEAKLVGGQRIDEELLVELLARPESVLLLALDQRRILACVHVELESPGETYLGMFTVDVEVQGRGIGDFVLSAAERWARENFKSQYMSMDVLIQRSELIAWYERRGYRATGEKRAFPYGNERLGLPLRADLEFVVLAKSI